MGGGGQLHAPASTSNPESLQTDPRFAPFLQEDFNPTDFASNALAGAHITAQAQTEQLQEGIQLLDERLRVEVIKRHDQLLRQAGRLRETEQSLHGVNQSVDLLQNSMSRVRSDIMEPYQQVKLKTRQLRNLHETVEILRHVIMRLKLMSRLKQQMASPQIGAAADLAKAAKLLTDIDAVGKESDLSGLSVVDADTDFLKETGQQVRSQAMVCMPVSVSL